MQLRSWTYLLPLCAAALTGCESPLAPKADNTPLTELPRQLSASERQVVQASNAFAFDILRETVLDQPAPNVFLSPLSASLALGMTVNGARGETQDEMRAVLGFRSAGMDAVNASYRSLIDLLLGLDDRVEMRLANSIWALEDFPIHQSFYDTAAKYFDASAATLDFSRSDAAPTINRWVETHTGGRIDRIVPDPIPAGAVMYLINAVYFKGDWRHQFDPRDTRDAPFHAADGETVVKMMKRRAPVWYHYDPAASVEIVESAYGRGAFAMTLVLPPAGTDIDAFIRGLNQEQWKSWTSALQERDVELGLPRFRLEYTTIMNEPLVTLGMGRAFGRLPHTDFSGLSPHGRGLYISNVVQKTFLDVNEKGTEAAAATMVEISRVSMPAWQPVTFDRPFVIAIRERFSGAILFLGKVGSP